MKPTIDYIVRDISIGLELSNTDKDQLTNVVVSLVKMLSPCCISPREGLEYLRAPRKFRKVRIDREIRRQLDGMFQDCEQYHNLIVTAILKHCKLTSLSVMERLYSEVISVEYERVG